MEWKTYIEPVRHIRIEVTEDNALAFCREFNLTLSFIEKSVPPHPTGRATVMSISGFTGRPFTDTQQVPFWVELRGNKPYVTNAPHGSWEVE